MYQLIKSILYDPEDKTRIHLVYANKSLPDVLLYQELGKLRESFPERLSVFYTLEEHPGAPYENMGKGRVGERMLSQNLPPPRLSEAGELESAVLVCGPDG